MLIHRDMWEAKVLLAAKGRIGRAAMAVIFFYWGKDIDRMRALCGLVWPGFVEPVCPTIASDGCKIWRDGSVRVDLLTDKETIVPNFVLFGSLNEMQSAFRRLADETKFSDSDRIDMFAALQGWIVGDRRQRFDEVEDKPRMNGHALNGATV